MAFKQCISGFCVKNYYDNVNWCTLYTNLQGMEIENSNIQ